MPLPMPTGARAVGAAAFAVLGWLLAHAYVPNMPFAQPMGAFRELTALLGAIVGWKTMGASVGASYWAAAGSGLKTAVVLVVWALLLFSLWEMVLESFKMRYDGPLEAVVDVFAIMLMRSEALFSVVGMAIFVIGGSIAGIATERASRVWP